jgi:cytochrome P450
MRQILAMLATLLFSTSATSLPKKKLPMPPGPSGLLAQLNAVRILMKPDGFKRMYDLMKPYADGFGISVRRIGPILFYFIFDGRIANHLLLNTDNLDKVKKGEPSLFNKGAFFKLFEAIMGGSMVVVGGEEWWRIRQEMNPFFSFQFISRYIPKMAQRHRSQVETWDLSEGKVVQFSAEARECSLIYLNDLVFETEISPEDRALYPEILELALPVLIGRKVLWVFYWPLFLIFGYLLPFVPFLSPYFKKGREFDKKNNRSIKIISSMIEERSSRPELITKVEGREVKGNFFDRLITLWKTKTMVFQVLTANVSMLFFGGTDTTTSAYIWLMWFLSLPENLKWRKQVLAEIEGLAGEPPTADQIQHGFATLKKCIAETLRLRSPSYNLPRGVQVEHDYTLPNGEVISFAKNALLGISAHHIHRSSAWGPDANVFNPDRADREGFAKISQVHNVSLGQGSRKCSGVVVQETQIAVSVITDLQAYPTLLLKTDGPKEGIFGTLLTPPPMTAYLGSSLE